MFLFKLCLTPLLILAASAAGRRWGNAVGGWIVGLPLTSGPVSVFLVLDQGAEFARQAAAGTLMGTAAQGCFAVAYFWMASRAAWPWAAVAGAAAFFVCAAILKALTLGAVPLFLIALATLTVGLAITPRRAAAALSSTPPFWDIPARMAVATTLVVSVTAGASLLGPRLSGILASFPIFALVLAVFAHMGQGVAAARLVVRGLMAGLYGFACFFATLGLLLARIPSPLAFAAACAVAMTVQGLSLLLIRRQRPLPAASGQVP